MYAIIKTGGKQYTVKPGDAINVEKIPGEAGDRVEPEVLLLNDGKGVVTDADKIAGTVKAQIVEQFKGDKQLVFKFKRRKGYKRTKGHRQQLTRIAIVEVNGEKAEAPKPKKKPEAVVAEASKAEAKKAEKPAPKKEAAPKAEPKKAEEPKAAAPAEEKQDFSKMTVAQLKEFAKEHDIKIASGARKAEIIETIENAL